MEDKFICAIAIFDEDTNSKFYKIRDELKVHSLEIDDIPPHITLAAYVDVDENDLCRWVEEFATNNTEIEFRFCNIGLFGLSIAFLAPCVSDELKEFHRRYHEKYDDMCGKVGLNYALKGNGWVPHATIVTGDEEKILKALPVINNKFEPFIGKIQEIALYELYPARKIASFKLNERLV